MARLVERKQNPKHKIPKDVDPNKGLTDPPRYQVTKIDGPDSKGAIYFVLRLDSKGDDPVWINCCRLAARALVNYLDYFEHLPRVAEDLEGLLDSFRDSVTSIYRQGNKLDPSNNIKFKAMQVCLELQARLDSVEGTCNIPQANVVVSEGMVGVSIGDIGVWDTETFGEDELTAEQCFGRFQQELLALVPYLKEAKYG